MLLVPSVPISHFTPFRSMTLRFRFTGRFLTRVSNDPKMTLNTARSDVPHVCVTSVTENQISIFFRVTAHFYTNTLNYPYMTLNTARLTVPYICCISTHESKSQSLSLYDQPPNDLKTLLVPPSSKLQSVSHHVQPFSSDRPFRDNCTERPPNDLEH